MAHELDMSNGRANIAFVGDTPWHGLGSQLSPGAALDVWKKEAGLNWNINSTPMEFTDDKGKGHQVTDKQVLYRSDTKDALGVVSNGYKIVQPGEIIDFYEDLVEKYGFILNTAGSLKGGRVIWALAETGDTFTLGRKDKVNGFLLLSTSNDKSMATRAQYTSVRVVCNNTLQWAYSQGDSKDVISVTHAAEFDHVDVKEQLGIYKDSWAYFTDHARAMAKTKIKDKAALHFLGEVFCKRGKDADDMLDTKTVKTIFDMFKGDALGSELASSADTVWGLVNSVTEYLDHHRGRDVNARLMNAWFKNGARLKTKAWQEAVKIVK